MKNETIKLFFDLEFTGLHQNTTPISLGIVSENDIKFYAEFNDYNTSQCDKWICDNVLNKLKLHKHYFERNSKGDLTIEGNLKFISSNLIDWLRIHFEDYKHVLFVGDCCSYDWILLQKILGGAFNMQKNIHYSPIDLDTLLIDKKFKINIERSKISNFKTEQKHNALIDAIETKEIYEIINQKQ